MQFNFPQLFGNFGCRRMSQVKVQKQTEFVTQVICPCLLNRHEGFAKVKTQILSTFNKTDLDLEKFGSSSQKEDVLILPKRALLATLARRCCIAYCISSIIALVLY